MSGRMESSSRAWANPQADYRSDAVRLFLKMGVGVRYVSHRADPRPLLSISFIHPQHPFIGGVSRAREFDIFYCGA